jgi:hypothetical protein
LHNNDQQEMKGKQKQCTRGVNNGNTDDAMVLTSADGASDWLLN